MSQTVKELLQSLLNESEVRATLSSLRAELKKDETERKSVHKTLQAQGNVLLSFLSHEDAKTRKNAALLLGELRFEEAEEALYEAYCRESTLFVRPAYLEALYRLGSEAFVPELREQLRVLEAEKSSEENAKHRAEERKLLRSILADAVGVESHRFTGLDKPGEILLLTNRNHVAVVKKQLLSLYGETLHYKELGIGVRLIAEKLSDVMRLRTFEELLFVLPGERNAKQGSAREGNSRLGDAMRSEKRASEAGRKALMSELDTKEIANEILAHGLLLLLDRYHEDNGQPYLFRIEYKGTLEPEKKGRLIRRISAELEEQSGHRLANSTDDYELELRLIENKEGKLNPLVKLFTMKDERFSYRKETVAAGMRPVNAALTMELTRAYLRDGAQVLDPFCGAGTMLVERARLGHIGNLYGIDRFGEAIEKAKKNTTEAGLFANYINRDFFDFRHEYLFDEIITDMPFVPRDASKQAGVSVNGKQEEQRSRRVAGVTRNMANDSGSVELERLYHRFFVKAKEHLKPDGVMILYVHNPELVRKFSTQTGYTIVEDIELNMRERTYVFVLRH